MISFKWEKSRILTCNNQLFEKWGILWYVKTLETIWKFKTYRMFSNKFMYYWIKISYFERHRKSCIKLSYKKGQNVILLNPMVILNFWERSWNFLLSKDKILRYMTNDGKFRIPTVKLKIPGKIFLKSESRTSVT